MVMFHSFICLWVIYLLKMVMFHSFTCLWVIYLLKMVIFLELC